MFVVAVGIQEFNSKVVTGNCEQRTEHFYHFFFTDSHSAKLICLGLAFVSVDWLDWIMFSAQADDGPSHIRLCFRCSDAFATDNFTDSSLDSYRLDRPHLNRHANVIFSLLNLLGREDSLNICIHIGCRLERSVRPKACYLVD